MPPKKKPYILKKSVAVNVSDPMASFHAKEDDKILSDLMDESSTKDFMVTCIRRDGPAINKSKAVYEEKSRRKAFGEYTGCPCPIKLETFIETQDKNLPIKDFNSKVTNLVKKWRDLCPAYQGYSEGQRITQNWNKSVKLPYGKTAHIKCVHNESCMAVSYCKLSLK